MSENHFTQKLKLLGCWITNVVKA